MADYFFNIWSLATMKIRPLMSQICQSRLSILPNKEKIVKNLPRICKLLPKWRNFTKSGHWQEGKSVQETILAAIIIFNKVVTNPLPRQNMLCQNLDKTFRSKDKTFRALGSITILCIFLCLKSSFLCLTSVQVDQKLFMLCLIKLPNCTINL